LDIIKRRTLWVFIRFPVLSLKLEGHQKIVTAMKPNNGYLFSASVDKTMNLKQWNITSGKTIKAFEGHSLGVSSISIIGDFLFSGSYDNFVIKWNVTTAEILVKFKGNSYSNSHYR
jgi:WD40 repeat protein